MASGMLSALQDPNSSFPKAWDKGTPPSAQPNTIISQKHKEAPKCSLITGFEALSPPAASRVSPPPVLEGFRLF